MKNETRNSLRQLTAPNQSRLCSGLPWHPRAIMGLGLMAILALENTHGSSSLNKSATLKFSTTSASSSSSLQIQENHGPVKQALFHPLTFSWRIDGTATETWQKEEVVTKRLELEVDKSKLFPNKVTFTSPMDGQVEMEYNLRTTTGFSTVKMILKDVTAKEIVLLDKFVNNDKFDSSVFRFPVLVGRSYEVSALLTFDAQTSSSARIILRVPNSIKRTSQSAQLSASSSGNGEIRASEGEKNLGGFASGFAPEHGGTVSGQTFTLSWNAPNVTLRFSDTLSPSTRNPNAWILARAPEIPTIVSPPVSVDANEGDSALFLINASGPGDLTYQWYFNDAPIPGATSATLRLQNVSQGAAGTYHVTVTNPSATVLSTKATLRVNGQRPVITQQPSSGTFTLGSHVAFSVSASGSSPMTFVWRKNGQLIPLATSATLVLRPFQEADQGDYQVSISNPFGTITSETVTIKAPPAAIELPLDPISQPSRAPGDLDQDGWSDLVWQHQNGDIATWKMQGTQLQQGSMLLTLGDAHWHLVGVSDFFGEGTPDLLLQHDTGMLAVSGVSGGKSTTQQLLSPFTTGDPQWRVAATGDGDGDGKTDLYFQHDNGDIAVWFMSGIQLIRSSLLFPSHPGDKAWRICGSGDIDGDGKRDILWQHASGSLAVWYMNAEKMVRAELFASQAGDPNWRVKAVVDFNRDGKPDLAWEHTDGSLGAWIMNGTRAISTAPLEPNRAAAIGLPNPWSLAGPK